MTRLIILILAYFFLSSSGMAQKYVRIKMHNTNLIKGYVLKSIDSSGLNLEVNGFDLNVPFSQIKRISFPRKGTLEEKGNFESNFTYPQFKKGVYHSFGMGLLAGGNSSAVNISLVNGYKINKHLHAGLGVNYQVYNAISTLPVYAETKGYLKQGKFVSYYYGDIGYGFLTKSPDENNLREYEANGGIFWAAGVGFQLNYFESALAFALGYNYQRVDESYSVMDWWGNNTFISKKNMFRRFEIKVSLIF